MFNGFTDATVDFMWGIRFNNEKPWFEAHKDIYLKEFYEPMRELAGEIYDHVAAQRPDFGLRCKITRIYRDARRLHGRGPYKDHLWFTIEQPSEQWTSRPSLWFELRPEGWSYGLGYWMPKSADMAKLRLHIDRDPKTMERLTRALERQSEFTMVSTDYKKPRFTPPSPVLEPWYRTRGFSISHEEPLTELLFSRALVEHLKEGFSFLLPYYDQLLAAATEGE